MTDFRHGLSIAILGMALCASTAVVAQGSGDAPAPAAETAASLQAASQTLQAGHVQAEFLTLGDGQTVTAGSSVFAQIKLSADIAAKKGAAAEIVVETDRGAVALAGGASGEAVAEGGGRILRARPDGLRKGRDRSLLVEVKLPADLRDSVTLKIVLRSVAPAKKPGDPASPAEATASISWTVRDCAGGYHTALRQLRGREDWRAAAAWRDAAKADAALPKGWVFAPVEQRRSGRRARSEIAGLSKAESAIFAEAGRLARAGRDPAFDRDSDLGWLLGKVAGDLDLYVSQPANPALCTGAIGMTDYYAERLAALGKRGKRLDQLAGEARALALSRVEAAFSAARALGEEEAGWSGVTAISAKAMTVRTDSLTGLALSLAELAAAPPELLARLKEARGPYEVLVPVEEQGIDRDGMPEAVSKPMRQAFTAIDAAARLEWVRDRHKVVQSAFEGRIQAIREAHRTHCVCGN